MPRGGQNKLYDENTKCEFEGCDRQATANWKCQAHHMQFKKNGFMWPVGEKKPGPNGGFADTKRCTNCHEVKHWTKFVMGLAVPTGECRECYRERLLAVEEEKPKNNVEDLLTFIDKAMKKKKK